jgi:hypothetical protein
MLSTCKRSSLLQSGDFSSNSILKFKYDQMHVLLSAWTIMRCPFETGGFSPVPDSSSHSQCIYCMQIVCMGLIFMQVVGLPSALYAFIAGRNFILRDHTSYHSMITFRLSQVVFHQRSNLCKLLQN